MDQCTHLAQGTELERLPRKILIRLDYPGFSLDHFAPVSVGSSVGSHIGGIQSH